MDLGDQRTVNKMSTLVRKTAGPYGCLRKSRSWSTGFWSSVNGTRNYGFPVGESSGSWTTQILWSAR